MIDFFLDLNIIQILIFVTFINILFIDIKSHRVVFFLLLISLINEILSLYLISKNLKISTNNNIYIITHNFLWLILIYKIFNTKIYILVSAIFFVFFSVLNLFFIEGFNVFNDNILVVGSIIYCSIFIIEFYLNLKKENFNLISSNNYLLLFSPILFFIGFGFICGFKNKSLNDVIIFNNIKLYTFIIYFVNIIYYSLINIYIYRERKLKDA